METYDYQPSIQSAQPTPAYTTGLEYDFCNNSGILSIVCGETSKRVVQLETDHSCPISAQNYAKLIDKISRIYALNFSNKTTTHLTNVLSGIRLTTILTTISTTAVMAHDLSCERFRKFNRHINAGFNNKRLIVRKKKPSLTTEALYSGHFRRKSGEVLASAAHETLHDMLSQLSHEVTTKFIAEQMISSYDSRCLQHSIWFASELTTLSAALNSQIDSMLYTDYSTHAFGTRLKFS